VLVSTFIDHITNCSAPSDLNRNILLVLKANLQEWTITDATFYQRTRYATLTTARQVIQFLNDNPALVSSQHVQKYIECPGCSKRCVKKADIINESAGLGTVTGHIQSCEEMKTRTNSYFCLMRAMGVPSFEHFSYVAPRAGSRDRARIHYYKEHSFDTILSVVHHAIQQAFSVVSHKYKMQRKKR
jgi:hypothetical protein